MAAPVKDGKVWRHRIMVKGKRISGTFDTKKAAELWEAESKVLMKTGTASVVNKTCADAFKDYAVNISSKKRGAHWEELRLAKMAKSPLGLVKMSEVNATHIVAWRDARLRDTYNGKPISGSTVNREMKLISSVFSVARKEWKWIEESPTRDVRRPKENKPRTRIPTSQEIEAICIALNWPKDGVPSLKQHRVALAFLFAIETAMRAGEICSLVNGSVKGSVAHLPMTKNGHSRDVPLSARALEIWGMVPKGFDLTPRDLDALFRKAKRAAGVEGVTFHDTRALALTRLSKKVDVLTLARIAGHSNLKMLMVYYRESSEDIAAKLA